MAGVLPLLAPLAVVALAETQQEGAVRGVHIVDALKALQGG